MPQKKGKGTKGKGKKGESLTAEPEGPYEYDIAENVYGLYKEDTYYLGKVSEIYIN